MTSTITADALTTLATYARAAVAEIAEESSRALLAQRALHRLAEAAASAAPDIDLVEVLAAEVDAACIGIPIGGDSLGYVRDAVVALRSDAESATETAFRVVCDPGEDHVVTAADRRGALYDFLAWQDDREIDDLVEVRAGEYLVRREGEDAPRRVTVEPV